MKHVHTKVKDDSCVRSNVIILVNDKHVDV
jgi:hypothetical protein